MPKMQVYLPDALYERVKSRGKRLNVSSILQRALEDHIAEMERAEALAEAVRAHEARRGRFSAEELARIEASDRAAARRVRTRRRGRRAA